MWFWITIIILGILYYLIKERGKHAIEASRKSAAQTPVRTQSSPAKGTLSAFNDPRRMSKNEYMRFRGYDPANPEDMLAAKDDVKPDDCLFDEPICIWRGKSNSTIEYAGGTTKQSRNVDLLELNLNGSADSLIFTAFCHLRNEERHFVAEKIKSIKFNENDYDIISFCHDVLQLPIYGKVATDEIIIFADSVGGLSFNTSKHFNYDESAKLARKLRKATK